MNDPDIELRQALHGFLINFRVAPRQIVDKTAFIYRVSAEKSSRLLVKQTDGAGRVAGKMQDRVTGVNVFWLPGH